MTQSSLRSYIGVVPQDTVLFNSDILLVLAYLSAAIFRLITSVKEVMFSSAFVCLLAGLHKNYLTDFHILLWQYGTWAMEKETVG